MRTRAWQSSPYVMCVLQEDVAFRKKQAEEKKAKLDDALAKARAKKAGTTVEEEKAKDTGSAGRWSTPASLQGLGERLSDQLAARSSFGSKFFDFYQACVDFGFVDHVKVNF